MIVRHKIDFSKADKNFVFFPVIDYQFQIISYAFIVALYCFSVEEFKIR